MSDRHVSMFNTIFVFYFSLCASQAVCETALLCQLCHSQQSGQESFSGSPEGPNTTTPIQTCSKYLKKEMWELVGGEGNVQKIQEDPRIIYGVPTKSGKVGGVHTRVTYKRVVRISFAAGGVVSFHICQFFM